MALLTDRDSKRVANAIIQSVSSIEYAVKDFLVPKRNKWHSDWFPLSIEEILNNLKNK